MKQIGIFRKIIYSVQEYLELHCLVDDLVDFFRIINVYQCFFALHIVFNEVDRRFRHKKNILLGNMYMVFFKKMLRMTYKDF